MSRLTIHSCGPLCGRLCVPGDKSISHRTLLLGCLASGDSRIEGFLPSADCLATLRCVRALDVQVEEHDATTLTIHGGGFHGLRASDAPLDCMRSGTTMRLLAGILAGQSSGVSGRLTGDPQLLRRPMARIVDPLRRMGADIATTDGHAPLTIRGRKLRGYDHTLPVASAQVKSAILLAGLHADGATVVRQPGPARDHTELMLAAMGADIDVDGLIVSLTPGPSLVPLQLTVPGDISSAAFPLAAAALVPGSEITIEDVGVNPTRTGLLSMLQAMGAEVTIRNLRRQGGEPMANVTVRASGLRGVEVSGETVVRMIDEFPALAAAATQAHGATVVREAEELRVKETDRIAVIASELRKLGARIEPQPDGFVVEGPASLHGGAVDSHGDHRIAMALVVAGLIADGEVVVENSDCIADSFPGFVGAMRGIGAPIERIK